MPMQVTPLAADSMGTRSMAVWVETRDGGILIDPSAGLAPLRYGLSPHPVEEWQLRKHLDRIRLFWDKAQAVVLTCFHADHFPSNRPEWTRGKILFIKNPNRNATAAERKRAFDFLKTAKTLARQIHFADDQVFQIGRTEIRFSPAFSDGQDHFVAVRIHTPEDSFLFSSEARGPAHEGVADFICAEPTGTLYLDGPVTYLQNSRESADTIKAAVGRLTRILATAGARWVILDHHLWRDLQGPKRIQAVFDAGRDRGIQIRSAAEYRGEEPTPLEARRSQLYEPQA